MASTSNAKAVASRSRLAKRNEELRLACPRRALWQITQFPKSNSANRIPRMAHSYVNTFYIAANIMFDLETGKTNQVFLLSSLEAEATPFSQSDADMYIKFVKQRARNIDWSIVPSVERPGMFLIKGVQYV